MSLLGKMTSQNGEDVLKVFRHNYANMIVQNLYVRYLPFCSTCIQVACSEAIDSKCLLLWRRGEVCTTSWDRPVMQKTGRIVSAAVFFFWW